MITFKENTFVKGTYDELMEMAKAIEERGAEIRYNGSEESNHLWWYDLDKSWRFSVTLGVSCDHELTKAQLYEAYGIVDFSILNETDVFYVELKDGNKYLFQSKQPFEIHTLVCVYLKKKEVYKLTKRFCNKDEVKTLRLATPQEIEPYKEHFKMNNMEKEPKFKKGDTVRCIGENEPLSSVGWKKGKEFIVDEIALHDRPLYFPKNGAGVWEEHLELVTVETRPIQISKETATRWYNGEDNELKQLAIQTFPELDEASPKVGDLCLFSNDEKYFNLGIGIVSIYTEKNRSGQHGCEIWGTMFNFCKKIKSIEFY